MNTQAQPNQHVPQTLPQNSSADTHPSVPIVRPKKSNQFLVWGPFFLFLFLFSMFSFAMYQRITAKPVSRMTPTPVLIPPTPTPYRALSAIATTRAFTTLDADMAAFAKNLSEFSVVDPNITPPSLVLPLDFKK